MSKIKLLHLITSLEVAGAQKVVFDICRLINLDEFEVAVAAISTQKEMFNVFEENNISVEILNVKKNIPSFLKGVFQIIDFIKKEKIDII